MLRLSLALALSAFALSAGPVAAQDSAGDKVRMVILYGDDAAPKAGPDEIIVVARMPEKDRFRIPTNLRESTDPAANASWASRVEKLEFVGASGTLSCSATGIGGMTGCTQDLIRRAYADKKASPSVRFGELIAAARAQRLATIDQTSAEEQARVEAIEKEYMDRLKKESEVDATTKPSPSEELPTPKSR